MNDKRLGRVQWTTLQGIIWKWDNSKRRSKDLVEAMATWETGARERGFADARAMLAAGPLPVMVSTAGLSPEQLARREANRRAMLAAGIASSAQLDAERHGY